MTGGPATTQPLGQGVTGLTLDLLAERIEHERELRQSEVAAVEKARQIQFNEYERRLETLNGEASRIRAVQDNSVPREVFENFKTDRLRAEELTAAAINARLTALERTGERTAGSIATWRFLAGGGGVLGLVSIALWVINARPVA